jgi:hypothetical protein
MSEDKPRWDNWREIDPQGPARYRLLTHKEPEPTTPAECFDGPLKSGLGVPVATQLEQSVWDRHNTQIRDLGVRVGGLEDVAAFDGRSLSKIAERLNAIELWIAEQGAPAASPPPTVTDAEIGAAADSRYDPGFLHHGFKAGARWVRERLTAAPARVQEPSAEVYPPDARVEFAR